MCFSASASFVAGGLLTGIGVVTLKKAKRKEEIPLAFIPFLFGLQQLTEGFVWISFRFPGIPQLNITATYLYTLFAFVLWPILIPFAVLRLETVAWRRKVLFCLQIFGLLLGSYLFYVLTVWPLVSEVVNHSIVYTGPHLSFLGLPVIYFSSTVFACLFSSKPLIRILGALILISAVFTLALYQFSFTSVWCFFAALLSSVVWSYFKSPKKSS